MFVLGDRWRDGYLDYQRSAGELRIQVRAFWPLGSLDDVFLEQPRSLRRLWNYYREVGSRELLRKVRSRLAETLRDSRFLSVGLGEVLETEAVEFAAGSPVVFLAPCHPKCLERVVLPPEFALPIEPELLQRLSRPDGICLYHKVSSIEPADWDEIAGWSRFSGSDVPASVRTLLPQAREALTSLDPVSAKLLPLQKPTPIRERSGVVTPNPGGLTAVLFGLGNYAKTCVLPNLDSRIRVSCIHEVDPTQLGTVSLGAVACDSADELREDENYDVYLIAGYHHTHAHLASRALRRGGWVISEKPLATNHNQLAELLAAMKDHPGRYFAGFHKRYNPLWDLAREDLQLRPGDPVNSHCTVFEVPLVRNHWYNWPNSCSRVVSNGCHWIDHFLFMNDFCKPVRHDLWLSGNGDVHMSAELENGASFNCSLTDIGSRRIGVQEHIELRKGEVTVRVDNGGRYESEDRFRILRRKRINKMASIHRLYSITSQKIIAGGEGDSLESTRRSSELVLAFEEAYQVQRSRITAASDRARTAAKTHDRSI